MKPDPSAFTSFCSRIGSPAMKGERAMEPVIELLVPYERGDILAALHREGEVLVEVHGERAVRVRVRLPEVAVGRFAEYEAAAAPQSRQ